MTMPLIPFTLAWLVGIWLASRIALPTVVLGFAAGVAILSVIIWRRAPKPRWGFILALAAMLGVLHFNLSQPHFDSTSLATYNDQLVAALSGLAVSCVGYLVGWGSALLAAFRTCWPGVRPQRCPSHGLSNVAESVLKVDTQLREQMRQDLGGLPAVPEQAETPALPTPGEPSPEAPLFCRPLAMLS